MKTSHHLKSESHHVRNGHPTAAYVEETGAAIVKTVVDAPATPGVPAPPHGFVATRGKRTQNVTHVQIDVGPGVANDLRSIPKAIFGHNPPDLMTLASGIEVASSWSSERLRTIDYLEYTRDREVAAWAPVLAGLDPLGRMFELAVERDPKLAEDYPSLAQFFGSRKAIAEKAARSRKLNKQTKTNPAASQPAPSSQSTSTPDPAADK